MRRKLEKIFCDEKCGMNAWKRILAVLQDAVIKLIFLLLGFLGYLSIARILFC